MNTFDTRTKELQEGQKLNILRNALLVAGAEMGDEGDHWPVIHATIHKIMKDWEDVKLERAADLELKKHVYEHLDAMEKELPNCTPEAQADLEPRIRQLREISDAYFSATDGKLMTNLEDEPLYLKRARTILATLEGDDHE